MGSLRAKQGSYIEILKAIQNGGLQGLTSPDRLLASQIWNTLNKLEYDSDLKLYLPFDEGSGTTAHDLSGNRNAGTVTGTTIVAGVFGNARNFDGIDDAIDCGTGTSINITGNITQEAWIQSDDITQYQYIIDKTGSTIAGYMLAIYQSCVRCVLWGLSANVFQGTITLTTGAMTHIAITYNGSYIKSYINGVFSEQIASSGTIADSASYPLNVGINDAGANVMDGILDEVRIYSRALSADEIYNHYLAGALKLGVI